MNNEKVRTTIEVPGEVVFSNLFSPNKYDDGETGTYNVTISIPKTDRQTLHTIGAAGRLVLGKKENDEITVDELGLIDGDIELSSSKNPVNPGHFQLRASCGKTRSKEPIKPQLVNTYNNPVELEWELGRGSKIILALSVSAYKKTVDKGIVRQEITVASYFIRKILAVDIHPYEDSYVFERFRNNDTTQTGAPADPFASATPPATFAQPSSPTNGSTAEVPQSAETANSLGF